MSVSEGLQRQINNLSLRLERTETYEGRSSSTGSCAGPYIVAASDATTESKNCATVVCDGTADESEINTAIALAGSFGFQVVLTEGTFQIASSITFGGLDDRVWLRGYGREATKIQCDWNQVSVSFDAIVLTSNFASMISDMRIDVDQFDFSSGAGDGIRFSSTSNNIRLFNLYIDNPENGIEFSSASQAIIRDVHIDAPQNRGVLGATFSESVMQNILVDGGAGVGFEITSSLQYSVLDFCGVQNFTGDGFVIADMTNAWLRDLRVTAASGNGIEVG